MENSNRSQDSKANQMEDKKRDERSQGGIPQERKSSTDRDQSSDPARKNK